MAEKKASAKTYQELSGELNELIEWFESESVNLDEAVDKYEQAMELLKRMEDHLKNAENKVKKIAVKFDAD
jgi:exodeoxyribonuclease VII small subunit